MPLSEEELRLLEQMERALVEEDPKFASTLRGTSLRRAARRRAILAGVVFVGGVALLLAGAILQSPVVGIVGFVVMLVCATIAATAMRGQAKAASAAESGAAMHPSRGFTVHDGGRSGSSRLRRGIGRGAGRGVGRGTSRGLGRTSGRGSGGSGSFLARMEDRWRRRREQGGF